MKSPNLTFIGAKILLTTALCLNSVLSEVRQININRRKFIEKQVPKSTLTLAKEFQSPSFSRLTCAMSTEVMGKQGFHFDREKQLCKIFCVKETFGSLEKLIDDEEMITIKVDGW